MKGLTVDVTAESLDEAQKMAREKAEKKKKDSRILWVEPEGEGKILYCSVCNIKSIQPDSKEGTCYDCTQ